MTTRLILTSLLLMSCGSDRAPETRHRVLAHLSPQARTLYVAAGHEDEVAGWLGADRISETDWMVPGQPGAFAVRVTADARVLEFAPAAPHDVRFVAWRACTGNQPAVIEDCVPVSGLDAWRKNERAGYSFCERAEERSRCEEVYVSIGTEKLYRDADCTALMSTTFYHAWVCLP